MRGQPEDEIIFFKKHTVKAIKVHPSMEMPFIEIALHIRTLHATLDQQDTKEFLMSYSPIEGKNLNTLRSELEVVYREYYESTSADRKGYCGPRFVEMTQMFAGDPFYKLHLVAKEFVLNGGLGSAN